MHIEEHAIHCCNINPLAIELNKWQADQQAYELKDGGKCGEKNTFHS
jgi:hypothetical protein